VVNHNLLLILRLPNQPSKSDFMQKLILRCLVSVVLLAAFRVVLVAQDSHYSQFYAAPLTLNPALTGAFEGRYRVASIYRDQWRSVLDEPIKSYGVAGDFRFSPRKRAVVQDAVGLGIIFNNDRVGVVDFNTTQIALSLAYHKSMGVRNDQFLSAGIQAGITQRSVRYGSLFFQDQFDGFSGFTGNTLEDLPANNFAYLDLNVGVNYSAKLGHRSNMFAGIAYHHFAQPVVSFDRGDNTGDLLYARFSAHVAANLPIGGRHSRVSFLPRVLFATQGPHLETTVGGSFRTLLGNDGGSAFHVGAWARPVRAYNGSNLDAVVALVGFELNSVLVGLSYDLNIGALSAKQRQGAFEISIAYLGNYADEGIICPKF
jgi:type IX secretion system PorP/SprF family membrane protein